MPAKSHDTKKPMRIVRLLKARPRLLTAAAAGVAVIAAIPPHVQPATRLLLGWDFGVTLYLLAAFRVATVYGVDEIRRKAKLEDEGRLGVLVLTTTAALASLAAIVVLLSSKQGGRHDMIEIALAVGTILLSWTFIHLIFALHYAHEFYGDRTPDNGGLSFPSDDKPDYGDFMYFSFVIGMTFQVSDVSISAKGIRRTVLAHGIVSFFFNVALLALMVNIAANII